MAWGLAGSAGPLPLDADPCRLAEALLLAGKSVDGAFGEAASAVLIAAWAEKMMHAGGGPAVVAGFLPAQVFPPSDHPRHQQACGADR